MTSTRLLLVGNPLPFHAGAHFLEAARALGLDVTLCDTRHAFSRNAWLQAATWRLLGKRPARLGAFSRALLEQARQARPDLLLAIGAAPITADTLCQLGASGVHRAIFLTDDPFNPAHRAPWFQAALPLYDSIFSPRRANLSELRRLGAATVTYLPFGYNPTVHYPASIPADSRQMGSDILFAGGADADRVPWIEAFIQAGMAVELYGGYWDRFTATRPLAHGHADLPTLRRAVPTAKVNLGLVRRANRDGHVMRTFEVPAMGGMLLAEDTQEHREILGAEGDAVIYFHSTADAVQKASWLLRDTPERRRLAAAAHKRITEGKHTYQDRLQTLIARCS